MTETVEVAEEAEEVLKVLRREEQRSGSLETVTFLDEA